MSKTVDIEPVHRFSILTISVISLVLLSIGTSIYILTTDDHIYEHAPSHRYELMASTGIYAALLGAFKFSNNVARKGILITAAVQFVLMNLDILATQNVPVFHVQGMKFNELFKHLYGSWYFDVLLGSQALLVTLSVINNRNKIAKIKTAELK